MPIVIFYVPGRVSGASSVDGLKAPRFEQWIRSFESILDIASWEDGKKIKLLSSKLTNLAAEALDDFLRSGSKSYAEIKISLMERFHGHETRLMYSSEYKTCRMQPSELPIDYACRLKKLFYFTFPLSESNKANTDTLNKLEEVLKDKFVDGLPLEIRHKVRDKTFETFDDLVKFTGRKVSNFEEEKIDREERKRIANIYGEVAVQAQPSVSMVNEMKAMASQIQEVGNQVAVIGQRQNNHYDFISQRQFIGQAAHSNNPVGSSADRQNQNQKQQNGAFRTQNSNQQSGVGGFAKTRYNPEKCDFCSINGHFKEDCRRFILSTKRCFSCNLLGHLSYSCPSAQQGKINQPNEIPPFRQAQQGN